LDIGKLKKEMIDMKRWVFILSVFMFWVFACQSISPMPPIRDPQITEESLPSKCYIQGINPVRGSYEASCVPACFEMIFRFYGKELKKEEIADWIQRWKGSRKEDFERFLVMKGFEVYTFYDWHSDKRKIKYFLSQGYPVLVAGQLGNITQLHMIILVGYDDDLEAPESSVNPKIVKGFFIFMIQIRKFMGLERLIQDLTNFMQYKKEILETIV
jgi:hypothetical protein